MRDNSLTLVTFHFDTDMQAIHVFGIHLFYNEIDKFAQWMFQAGNVNVGGAKVCLDALLLWREAFPELKKAIEDSRAVYTYPMATSSLGISICKHTALEMQ